MPSAILAIPSSIGTILCTLLRELLAEDAEALGHGHHALAADVDGLDEDAQDVARVGAFDVDRSGRRVHPVPVDGVQDVALRLHLVVEAVGRLQPHAGAGADRKGGLGVTAEGEDAAAPC